MPKSILLFLSLVVMYNLGYSEKSYGVVQNESNNPNKIFANQIKNLGIIRKEIHKNNNVLISVIDSSIQGSIPEVKKYLSNNEFTDRMVDENGHGTLVTGTMITLLEYIDPLASETIKILPIPIYDDFTEEAIASAIISSIEKRANIVLVSLGIHKNSHIIANSIRKAEQAGVLVIAAAGNQPGEVMYPAAYSTVLSVGGLGMNATDAWENSANGEQLDVIAPAFVKTINKEGEIYIGSGTSMAAPCAAVVAALLINEWPTLTPIELRDSIKLSAFDLKIPGWDSDTGFGVINLSKSLQFLNYSKIQNNFTHLQLNKRRSLTMNNMNNSVTYMLHPQNSGFIELEFNEDADYFDIVVTRDNARINYEKISNKIRFPVMEQTYYIVKVTVPSYEKNSFYYVTPWFSSIKDPYELNNTINSANDLTFNETDSAIVYGTFHNYYDKDYYRIYLKRGQYVLIRIESDSLRVDPNFTITNIGAIDFFKAGSPEMLTFSAENSSYYTILIENTLLTYSGKYTLTIKIY